MAKNCPACRTVIEDSLRFCGRCGYQFASDPRADLPPGVPLNARKIFKVCAVVAVGLGIVTGALLINDYQREAEQERARAVRRGGPPPVIPPPDQGAPFTLPKPPPTPGVPTRTAYQIAMEHPERLVTLSKFSWEKGGFDTVMIANFTLKNENEFPVKDFVLSCDLYGNSGTQVGTVTHTLLEIVGGGKTKRFNDVNMGFVDSQAKRSSCALKAAVATDLLR